MQTHVIIETENGLVALAVDLVVTDCENNLDKFKAACNPDWHWDDATKVKAFNKVQEAIAANEAEAGEPIPATDEIITADDKVTEGKKRNIGK